MQAAVVAARAPVVLEARLVDPDDYMRLVRVEQLWKTGDWYDARMHRSNAPFGETSHWTRAFDAVLLAGGALLAPVVGFERGLFWVGALTAPLLHLAILLLVPWAAAPLLDRHAQRLAVLAVLAQPAVMSYAIAGRADHHMLLLLAFVVTVGLALRALVQPGHRRPLLFAGLVAAAGTWVSVEFLLVVAVTLATLAALWVVKGPVWTAGNVGFATGLAVGGVLCLAVERAPASWLSIEYDRLSVVHVTIGVFAVAFWRVLAGWSARRVVAWRVWTRGALVAVGAIAAAGAMAALYPGFWGGPTADVDPRIIRLWLDRVEEFQPLLLPTDLVSLGRFVAYLGATAVCAPFVAWMLARERDDPAWSGWLYLATGLAAFVPAALLHLRFATYAEILLAVVTAALLSRLLLRWPQLSLGVWRAPLRVGMTATVLVGFLALGWGVQTAAARPGGARTARPARSPCELPEVARVLADPAGLGRERRTILAFWDYGSELLYRTPHAVVGTPYHRNAAGILDTYGVFTARDDRAARAVIERRGINLVLVCRGGVEAQIFQDPDDARVLHRRLVEGSAPAWLGEVALPPQLAAFRLYRVRD